MSNFSCHKTAADVPNNLPCRARQFVPAVPFAFVPPVSVGNYYSPPTPNYPIIRFPFSGQQMYTPRPSYLNAIGNEQDHPLHFMALTNRQRY